MRFLTKEWYETMQKTDLHLLLKTSQKAEVFSEEFYRKLYVKKEAEQLKFDEECSNTKFEDIFDEFDFPSKEEYKKAREEFVPEKFDPVKTKQKFREAQEYNIERLKIELPEEILEKVADVRVLALDCCTAEVKKLITRFCKENEKKVDRAVRELEKAEQKEFGDNPPDFIKESSLHDCEITAFEESGKDVVLSLDNSGGFTTAKAVIFKNAEIIERDGGLVGAIWLYDEIYKIQNGFEIHALMSDESGLLYFTVSCETAEFLREE